MAGVQLLKVDLDSALARPLLIGLTDEYQARYGAQDEMSKTAAAEFMAPEGLFVVLVTADR